MRLLLDDLGLIGPADAVELQARRDVVLDRERGEGVGTLEDHPDAPPHRHRIHGWAVEVLAVELDRVP